MGQVQMSDPPEAAAASEAIAALARRFSIESSTRNLVEIDGYASLLPAGTDVFVTYLPATPYLHIIAAARRLRGAGMNPVPHIAARRLADRAVATDFLARLRDEARVTRVLLVAGDSRSAVGPYESSLALLESGLLQEYGIASVGFAGYPEGHRKISEAALADALDRKIACAQRHGLESFVVSQFCFDGGRVIDWLKALRARGVTLPVRLGVAGPAAVRTLLDYGLRCGVGDSLRAFGARPVSLTRLLMPHGPERVVRAVAPHAETLGVAGLHLFPFGGLAASARWVAAVGAARFRLDAGGDGFTPG